jgi:rRNA maturation endonuclease Nob1
MRAKYVAALNEQGNVEPEHEIEVVCANCGYDLDAAELEADTCSDCGNSLELKRSVAITVTTVPLFGATLE